MSGTPIFDGPLSSLVPKSGEFPVSAPAYYQQLVITDNAESGAVAGEPLDDMLDPFASASDVFSRLPATGVLLTFEQAWRQEGLALGELRHSLCLAPGEVTKVAVVDWRRDTRAVSSDSTSQQEQVAARSDGSQAMRSVQRAVATEVKSGLAVTHATAAQSQAAASGGGLLFSASGATANSSTRGLTATSSRGSREVASDAVQDVQRRTLEMSSATRSRRATQIREVSESERQQTTTRVVANYNHMHAMTMQYYEVLQVYALETRVVKAERCVFVPMAVQEFSAKALREKPEMIEALRRVLIEFGAVEMAAMLDQFELSDDQRDESLLELKARLVVQQETVREYQARLRAAIDVVLEIWPGVVASEGLSAGDALFDPPSRADLDIFHKKAILMADIDDLEDVAAALLPPSLSLRHIKAIAEMMEDTDQGEYADLLGALMKANASVRTLQSAVEAKQVALDHQQRLWPVLEEHRLFLNQQMWMRVDAHRWYQMLAGKTYPDGEFAGHQLGGLVDPSPLGYFGNFIAFRWDFPRGSDKQRQAFEREYVSPDRRSNKDRDELQDRVVLPTEGVFAEAVLGQSNSAEKLDVTRFWNWQDSPIPILPPEMSPVGTGSRARDVAQSTLDFAGALATLRQRFDSLDGTPDNDIVQALTVELFGDGSGIQAAAAGAAAAGANAATGAAGAQQATVDLQKNAQDFVVGLANSEVGTIAATAIASKSGGISSVGGLVNAARSKGDAAT